MEIRPMLDADLPDAARASAAALGFSIEDDFQRERWHGRLAHLLATDPEGCFVAVQGDRVVGLAEAARRETLWCLSMLAVDPAAQSSGAGRALLDAALTYGADTPDGLIVSSNHPSAMRLYARSGFALAPALEARGTVRAAGLPDPDGAVSAAGGEELAALEPISRAVRGAAHTRELAYVLGRGGRLFRLEERGFTVVMPDVGVWLLAAHDEAAARTLLVTALHELDGVEGRPLRWITAEQPWAVQLAVAAGLSPTAYGALAVRGRPGPLAPFLPSPPFG